MAIFYSPKYNNHQKNDHIENKSRTDAIITKFSKIGIFNKISLLEPESCDISDILAVHSSSHIHFIQDFCKKGGGYLDLDTYASSQSYHTALLSAGGAIAASKSIMNGEKWSYSISRPPGHHATAHKSMGFCIFNNVAIALKYLIRNYGLHKICIIDFDVHYGNGTAEIFYNDPNILYISIHQDPKTLFPGKGFIEEQGSGKGEGYNINIPMPIGSNNTDYIWILKEILEPVLKEFRPQVLFVEAGFDAHVNDPLSGINVNEYFYAWISQYLIEKNINIISLLEGGYNLEALSNSNLSFIVGLEPALISDNNDSDNYSQSNQKTSETFHINKNEIKYKSKEEIERYYLEKFMVSPDVKQSSYLIKDIFSPFFKF
ncbi:MAG: histone deacetylase [Methanobacteriaceae archaeon]|nr:histone deacetylase [Methanobacteriaceae archaeon]